MLDSLPEGLTRPSLTHPGSYDPQFSHMMNKFWGMFSPPASDGSSSHEAADDQKHPGHSGKITSCCFENKFVLHQQIVNFILKKILETRTSVAPSTTLF